MTSRDVFLLQAMFDEGRFIRRFILGPSFAQRELDQLFASLYASPDLLLDPFLACSAMFRRVMKMDSASRDAKADHHYKNSARAVKALRERGDQDGKQQQNTMSLDLALGLGVVTFDLMDSGLHGHSVARYTIRMLQGHSPSSRDAQQGLYRGGLPLIFMDTCNCIVRRQVPVLRLPPPTLAAEVDRYIGLSTSLLPLLFDICLVSHELSVLESRRDEGEWKRSTKELDQELLRLDSRVRSWNALTEDVPIQKNFTPSEIAVMTKQATLLKASAILILHRLRFPFGTNDEPALELATLILVDINTLYHDPTITADEREPRGGVQRNSLFEYRLGLPFLVAAVELQDPGQRKLTLSLLQHVVCKRMYPSVHQLLGQFVEYVWSARDSGFSECWMDLTAPGPPLVLF